MGRERQSHQESGGKGDLLNGEKTHFVSFYLIFSFMPLPAFLLITLPSFLPHSPNYESGRAAAYVRTDAVSAKQLSNTLGGRLPRAGQPREKPFFLFIEC